MALTKQKLQAIRVDLQAALDTVAKKHGLARLVAGNCTFEKTGAFTWKLEGIEEGGLAKEQRRYDENKWLGLPDRGATFKSGGKTHTCWGLNSTGSKVITECDDGKRYNWPVEVVQRFFPKEEHDARMGSDLKKIVGACKEGGTVGNPSFPLPNSGRGAK